MVKDSDEQGLFVGILFYCPVWFFEKGKTMKPSPKKKDVIAYRKTCAAKGTGLSHYILMDKKAK